MTLSSSAVFIITMCYTIIKAISAAIPLVQPLTGSVCLYKDWWHIETSFCLSLPKAPPGPTLTLSLGPHPISSMDAPEVHRDACNHKGDHYERLQCLGEDGAAEQEQTDAAEDDGGGDPGLVGSLEVRFTDAQDNEAEDGEEVEGVAGDAVEGDESAEFADDAVAGGKDGVEDESVDGGEEEACIFVAQKTAELLGEPATGSLVGEAVGFVIADANAAEDGGEVAFFAGDIDEAAGGEGG